MPTEYIDYQLVVWKPNTDQVVSLENGDFMAVVPDADYPAITSTKNLAGFATCYSDSTMIAGTLKTLPGTATGKSTGTLAKLAVGYEIVDGTAVSTSTTPRCAIFGAGYTFNAPFQTVDWARTVSGASPVTNIVDADGGGSTFYIALHNRVSTINIYRIDSTAATLLFTAFTEGQVVGATTIAAGELPTYHDALIEYTPYFHLRRNPTNGFLNLVIGGYNTNKLYYWRQTGASTSTTFYLNTHTTFAPKTSSFADLLVYPETDTLTHIFYLTQFNAQGKTYITPAMMTYNSTTATWSTAVRFGGSTWDSNGYSVGQMQLYRADANDPQKLYLMMYVSGGRYMIVWVDLATRTASTTPIYTSATGFDIQFTVALWNKQPAVDDSVLMSGQTGFLLIRAGQPTADLDDTTEDHLGVSFTIAGWKTPTVTLYQSRPTFTNASSVESWFYSTGYQKIGSSFYHFTYAFDADFSNFRYLSGNYRVIEPTNANAWALWGQIGNVGGVTFTNTGSRYYMRGTEQTGSAAKAQLVGSADGSGNIMRFYHVLWGRDSFDVHFAGSRAGVASATMNLSAVTQANNVELDGILTSLSSAIVDLFIGSPNPLDGLLTSLSSATMNLQATNANVDASVFCTSSTYLDMRIGKVLLEALLQSSTQHQAQLTVLHDALLDGTLGGTSSASLTLQLVKELASSSSASAAATLSLDNLTLIAGTASASSSATVDLFLERYLSALLLSQSTATMRLARAVDLVDGVSVLVKNAPVSVRTKKP